MQTSSILGVEFNDNSATIYIKCSLFLKKVMSLKSNKIVFCLYFFFVLRITDIEFIILGLLVYHVFTDKLRTQLHFFPVSELQILVPKKVEFKRREVLLNKEGM